jgi:hypothetical protein
MATKNSYGNRDALVTVTYPTKSKNSYGQRILRLGAFIGLREGDAKARWRNHEAIVTAAASKLGLVEHGKPRPIDQKVARVGLALETYLAKSGQTDAMAELVRLTSDAKAARKPARSPKPCVRLSA